MSSSKFPLLIETEPAPPAADGKPEQGPVYRAALTKDQPWPPTLPDATTCYELFTRSVARFGDAPCLGQRAPGEGGAAGPYVFRSYKEVGAEVALVGAAMSRVGLAPKASVGVLSANCVEWMVSMQATNRQSLVCVPLYETLGDNAVQYIMRHSGVALVMAAAAKLPVIAKALSGAKDIKLKGGVVYWGKAAPEAVEALRATGTVVRSWDELLELGRAAGDVPPVPPKPDDICTVMYTSGTTGDPKGVVMKHSAVLSTVASVRLFMAAAGKAITWGGISPEDAYLSYLPLAHIFGRVVEELMLSEGGCIGYWQGDARKLMDDVAALRPTIFAAVPRILERIYKGVTDKVKASGAISSAVFNLMYALKLRNLRAGYSQANASWLADRLVFNSIKGRLGGRVRVVVSGASSLAPAMEEFLRVVLCVPIVQGYGLTETCAASFIARPDKWEDALTVGPPQPSVELKLEAVPELGYSPLADPPRGEVLVRGPGVFSGYLKAEALTKEVVDADGFFHTGDIGEITGKGALRIIDRKKNIFKLSHGEYIAVEKVEGVYASCPLVEQVWVYGDSTQPCLLAVVVPAHKALLDWAAGVDGLKDKDYQAVCATKEAKAHVLSALAAHGRANKLNGLEIVKGVILEHEQFSVDNDLITPSFKLKRPQLLAKYKPQLTALYADLTKAEAAKASS